MNTTGKCHAVPSPIKAHRWAKSALNFIFCFLHSMGTHTCLNGDDDDDDDNGDDEIPLVTLCRVCEGSITAISFIHPLRYCNEPTVCILCHLGYAWYE